MNRLQTRLTASRGLAARQLRRLARTGPRRAIVSAARIVAVAGLVSAGLVRPIAFDDVRSAAAQDVQPLTLLGNLDQCGNGPVASPVPCTGSAWQNGDLNGNQAHYLEGDSVPYRLKGSNRTSGTACSDMLPYGDYPACGAASTMPTGCEPIGCEQNVSTAARRVRPDESI
jgi:hypothetical protein